MQQDLLDAARTRREQNSVRGVEARRRSWSSSLETADSLTRGWCGDTACEADIKEQTKATIRCLPDEEFRSPKAPTRCMWCNRPAVAEAVWAKAY